MMTCPAVTTLCGLINGAIIFDLNVPAMIATLGTQNVIRGIVKLLCGAEGDIRKGAAHPRGHQLHPLRQARVQPGYDDERVFFAYLLQNGRKHDIT